MYRFFAPVLLVAFGAVVGCSAADKVDNAADCQSVCNKYRECFDGDYDVDNCADKCRANAENDKDFLRKADVCSACIGDQSCTGATFDCASDCAGIVP